MTPERTHFAYLQTDKFRFQVEDHNSEKGLILLLKYLLFYSENTYYFCTRIGLPVASATGD
jgi:uncharacterized FlgJ-related protein